MLRRSWFAARLLLGYDSVVAEVVCLARARRAGKRGRRVVLVGPVRRACNWRAEWRCDGRRCFGCASQAWLRVARAFGGRAGAHARLLAQMRAPEPRARSAQVVFLVGWAAGALGHLSARRSRLVERSMGCNIGVALQSGARPPAMFPSAPTNVQPSVARRLGSNAGLLGRVGILCRQWGRLSAPSVIPRGSRGAPPCILGGALGPCPFVGAFLRSPRFLAGAIFEAQRSVSSPVFGTARRSKKRGSGVGLCCFVLLPFRYFVVAARLLLLRCSASVGRCLLADMWRFRFCLVAVRQQPCCRRLAVLVAVM